CPDACQGNRKRGTPDGLRSRAAPDREIARAPCAPGVAASAPGHPGSVRTRRGHNPGDRKTRRRYAGHRAVAPVNRPSGNGEGARRGTDMTDWRTLVREAFENTAVEDADDDKLSRDAALAMRRVVVAAVTADAEAPFSWRNPLAVGAALALMVASGLVAGLGMSVRVEEPGVTSPHRP